MRSHVQTIVALLALAAAPAFAQDWYEPAPSLAELSADEDYARESARSFVRAGMGAVAIRLDGEGRVLVAGSLGRVVRLDADGRIDPTFGRAGIADLPVWGDVAPGGLEVDALGRIVVTGSFYEAGTNPGDGGPWFGAVRLLANGLPDAAFSGDGLLEFDPASEMVGLGAVRATGSEGAMLAVAEKPDPAASYRALAGLVRIAADGTIDATYGAGGFAQVAPLDFSYDYRSVADFEVDPLGRAVVAVENDYGPGTVLRLDAAGGPDPSYYGYTSFMGYVFWNSFAASQLALDGAGRIVGLSGEKFLRRLEDGAPDPAFSVDGFGWNQAAHIVELTSDARAAFCELERTDLIDPVDPRCGGALLAVATAADPWALAMPVEYRNAKERVVARGINVRAIDPADPGAIVSTTYRSRDTNLNELAGLAIAPDGSTVYALGDTYVLRVDLAARKALPLPDLRAHWMGNVEAIDLGGGRYQLSARVRIRNASRRDAESVVGFVDVGDGKFEAPLALRLGSSSSLPFRVRARSSVVKRFTWEGGDIQTNLAGVRLGIQVSCELPDANFADNTALSLPITPRYAPR